MTQLSLFPKVRTPKARTPQQQLKRRSPEQRAKSRAYDRAYNLANPGRHKVWKAQHPDYYREWRAKHPGYMQTWLAQHPGYYRERRVRAERLRLLVDLQNNSTKETPCPQNGNPDQP